MSSTGSTSTKLAVYENENPIWRESIAHPSKELAGFHHINEQYEYRRKCVHDTLEKAGIPLVFDAVIARGGLLKPTPGGVYQINERINMIYACRYGTRIDLAAWIADEIAHCAGCPSYLADPVVTDELRDLARISGIPELPRISIFHALNSRAVSRSYAARIGRSMKS